eukprot:1153066-Pelagomonas_calceolata.AAC.2
MHQLTGRLSLPLAPTASHSAAPMLRSIMVPAGWSRVRMRALLRLRAHIAGMGEKGVTKPRAAQSG